MEKAVDDEQIVKVNEIFDKKIEEADQSYKEDLNNAAESYIKQASQEIVTIVETAKQEKESNAVQINIKDRLRGFTRTIPAFLMAYGVDENHMERQITLSNFDQIVPAEVFQEVTSTESRRFPLLTGWWNKVESRNG